MPASNPLDILLRHNHWATQAMLDACAGLSEQQFHQRFEMGCGSLHDNLTHIIGAMRGWGDMLAGRAIRERPEGVRHSVDELRSKLDEATNDLQATAAAHPVDEVVTAERGGKQYSFTRGGVLTHVTTHGMHHRAQCLNMLRQLGVDPLPPSAVVEWIFTADAAK